VIQRHAILKDNSACNDLVSSWSKIQHGVPQGSVLGPLLFILYVNDLPLAIDGSSTSILFTDDTSLIVTDKNLDILDTKLSENLQLAYNWFKSNLLTINLLKTLYTIYNKKLSID
jgi:hypothetical protein